MISSPAFRGVLHYIKNTLFSLIQYDVYIVSGLITYFRYVSGKLYKPSEYGFLFNYFRIALYVYRASHRSCDIGKGLNSAYLGKYAVFFKLIFYGDYVYGVALGIKLKSRLEYRLVFGRIKILCL